MTGIYTGILAITLWNIFINKHWPIRRAMIVVIILLYILTTISFSANWSAIRSAFIENGQSFWTIYMNLTVPAQAVSLEMGITASIGTVFADLYIIWWCWVIWGRRWLVVLLPIFSLVSATVSRIIAVYYEYAKVPASMDTFLILYISFSLATTLSCTLLIIYRILTVTGVRRRAEGRLGVYHHFIEVLVESSALYSISLILYLAFTIRDNWGEVYFDVIAVNAKGIAPTLLVGRFTTGHRARPDDSWRGSVMASASIREEQEHSRTSSQEDRLTSLVLDGDLEAQREISVREPSLTSHSVSVVVDHAHPNTDAALENVMSSPHLAPLQPFSPLRQDASRNSSVVDEAATPSR
ncbi:uncharacterized protein EV420DRAFT_616255 [Desarmillaria tabescens]|uniref:Uncharacterized protein n=1 Tax=Armillaria tabescens TaxID=1929756 RepID=A0AA39K893_ARMTA|nr:uncharacterized protein EV420DRAFT_616255 [Desarmillaria tabescens]KAK0454033.1 hypothetical protein EV420DRAFT_616255 [Desarmillaria tabescens]